MRFTFSLRYMCRRRLGPLTATLSAHSLKRENFIKFSNSRCRTHRLNAMRADRIPQSHRVAWRKSAQHSRDQPGHERVARAERVDALNVVRGQFGVTVVGKNGTAAFAEFHAGNFHAARAQRVADFARLRFAGDEDRFDFRWKENIEMCKAWPEHPFPIRFGEAVIDRGVAGCASAGCMSGFEQAGEIFALQSWYQRQAVETDPFCAGKKRRVDVLRPKCRVRGERVQNAPVSA